MEVRRRDGGAVAVEMVGDPVATPVLLCHGLADSRLAVHRLAPAAQAAGLRVIAPDRPGTGETAPRWLHRVVDWVDEAALVLDALGLRDVQVLGISGGGAFAAACAARLPRRVSRLTLVAPLGPPHWPTDGMAPWQRRSLGLGRRAPGFGGWFLARLATLARRTPRLYFGIVTAEMPEADRRVLARPDVREDFRTTYVQAFRNGGAGVAQDLRVLTHPWGFELAEVGVPTVIHQGDADTTVPPGHARRYAAAIPDARLELYPGDGHFSIPARWGWFADGTGPQA